MILAATDDQRFDLEILLPTEEVAGYAWLDKEGHTLTEPRSLNALRVALVWGKDGKLIKRLVCGLA